ncbi:MAG TPA: hypothetical protein DCP20_08275 [Coriobacteriia bacterium]|nr:hypothetical protein [Coriobacteriia bacterium]
MSTIVTVLGAATGAVLFRHTNVFVPVDTWAFVAAYALGANLVLLGWECFSLTRRSGQLPVAVLLCEDS